MSRVIAVVVALLFAGHARGCDPLKGIGFNPDCDGETPYCANSAEPTATPEYSCVACVSNCDCKEMNFFCTSEFGSDYGTCIEFEPAKDAKECLPFTTAQLRDKDFDEDLKCAKLFEYTPSTPGANATLVVDQEGECIEAKCRYCNPRGSGGMAGCDPEDGLFLERECVYPGYLVNSHDSNWTPGNYYEDPQQVWWAIFFTFFVLLLCCQCAQTISMLK